MFRLYYGDSSIINKSCTGVLPITKVFTIIWVMVSDLFLIGWIIIIFWSLFASHTTLEQINHYSSCHTRCFTQSNTTIYHYSHMTLHTSSLAHTHAHTVHRFGLVDKLLWSRFYIVDTLRWTSFYLTSVEYNNMPMSVLTGIGDF